MKRIIAIILIVISLCACIPLGAYAADTEVKFVWKDITKTSIKEDLPDLDFAQFAKNAELFNIYVVTLCEQYENKRLYIYIYYPFQDSLIKRGKNKIQMKCGESWEKYNLEYISDYNNIIKFRAMLPDTFFDKLNKHDRIYEISGVELERKTDGLKEYKVGGTYKFRGFLNEAKLVDVDTFEVIPLEVGFTTMRNPSAQNASIYNQLTSVYFSIPNSLLEKYNQRFYGIEVEYEKYQTKPILVTDSPVLAGQLSAATTSLLSFVSDTNAGNKVGYYYDKYIANGVNAYESDKVNRYLFSGWHYNFVTTSQKSIWDGLNGKIRSDDAGMQMIPIIIETKQDITEKTWVSSQEVIEKLESFLKSSIGQNEAYTKIRISDSNAEQGAVAAEVDYYHSMLFQSFTREYTSAGVWEDSKFFAIGDSPKVRKKITMDDDLYNLICYGDTHTAWQEFWERGFAAWFKPLMNDTSYTQIRPIQIINMVDVKDMSQSKFAAAYAVDANDVVALKQYAMASSLKNRTTYLFRVDFGEYLIHEAETREKIKGTTKGHAVMISETVYMGFDVIDIMFKDEEGCIVTVAAITTPKTVAGGLFFPFGDGTNDEDKEVAKNVLKIIIAVVGVAVLVYLYFKYAHIHVKRLVTGVKKKTNERKRTSYKKRGNKK